MELSDGIDLVSYSMMNAQTQTMQAVSTQVLAKSLDMMEVQGAQMTKMMMEMSVNPNLGGNIDVLV